jgi:hypothetical protein
MAFDDGTPLDAAKLQALETELNNIKSSIPKVGSSVTNVTNVTNQTITQKQIIGGLTQSISLVPGKEVELPINYSADSQPSAVMLTPAKSAGALKGSISYFVDINTVSSNGALAKVLLDKSASGGFAIRFYFTVICG